MASRKKKNRAAGIIIGPILVIAALSALWKNETRFDYHKAATKTLAAPSIAGMEDGRNHSYTGAMDPSLTLPGAYIASFTGYLVVDRSAEIYCWDRDEDDDGDVTWTRRWMSSVESNSRNSGIRQELSPGRILPPSYEVADLVVDSEKIEFVDSRVEVLPGPLPKTEAGRRLGVEGGYLMLRKGQSDNLGDERLSYRAIPVPPEATWFGRYGSGRGVADVSEQKSGMINSIIQNSGVLHHLVAGNREVALGTMKRHIERLKWIVRGIGTAVVIFGLLFLFSSILRFLYGIPILGRIAETGAFLLALALGFALSMTTIALGFIAGNPILLVPILLVILAGIVFLVRLSGRQRKRGEAVKQQLDSDHGHALERDELKQLEYREMAGMLVNREGGIGSEGVAALDRFAKKNNIAAADREILLQEAKESVPSGGSAEMHLRNLIRFAVADSRLTPHEIRSIREAATLAGYDREAFRRLMAEVSRMADQRKAS